MDEPILAVAGVGGQIDLYEHKVVIRRKGMLAAMTQGLKGDKEILIKQIASIQFKKAGMMTNGYIQFAFVGGQEAKGGLFQAAADENTVMFNTKQQPDFEKLKAAIEQRIAQPSGPQSSISDELEKLAALRDRGILTEEEFSAKKKQMLGL